jgi:hypothetical protein
MAIGIKKKPPFKINPKTEISVLGAIFSITTLDAAFAMVSVCN